MYYYYAVDKRWSIAGLLALSTIACKVPGTKRDSSDASTSPSDSASVASPDSDPKIAVCEGAGAMAPVACDDLGDKFARGIGVAADPAKGAAYYQKGCDKGMSLACRKLGLLYSEGRGVPMNRAKAIEFLDRACARGLDLGCEELGELYDTGKAGGPVDIGKAVSAYQRGCDIGSGRACRELGRHYKDGSGVPKDVSRGIGLYEKACITDRLSCDFLGDVYAKGMGVPIDKTKAVTWYGKGCTAGLELACQHLKELTPK